MKRNTAPPTMILATLMTLASGLVACDEGSLSGDDVELKETEMRGNAIHVIPDQAAGGVPEWWLGLDPSGATVACNCNQDFPTAQWSFDEGAQVLVVTFPNGSDDPPTETYTFSNTESDGRAGEFQVTIENAIETIEMEGSWTKVDGYDVCPAPSC